MKNYFFKSLPIFYTIQVINTTAKLNIYYILKLKNNQDIMSSMRMKTGLKEGKDFMTQDEMRCR